MVSFLKKLFGGASDGGDKGADTEAVEYKGHLIRPTPMKQGAQFQTAGTIEKEIGAVSLIVIKGQQIIDEQGDRIYVDQR